jgi:threonyl-tRNA synthetase
MFAPIEMDNETFVLRPMTCPHHMTVYKTEPRSYRDLPIRYAEFGEMYRFEASGALTGLERVRAMTLNDAHIFCTREQIKEEFKAAYELVNIVIKKFNLEIDYIELALRDPKDTEKYHHDDET